MRGCEDMRRTAFYAALILLISAPLRLYPTIFSGLPFSTDSWPLIRNAEKLLENTPIPLNGDAFDGYNIYWPLSQIYGAITSLILSEAPMDCMRILVPFAASFAPLILYLIVRRLANSDLLGFLAGLLFAAGGSHAVFTAGVTKESFANMLFFQSIYFFSCLSGGLGGFLGYAITLTALIMSHHLTYLVLAAIMVNALAAEIFLPRLRKGSTLKKVMMIGFAAAAGSIYYSAYAFRGLKIIPSFSDLLSAFSFQVIAFTAMFYVVARPAPRRLPNSWVALTLSAFIALSVNQITPLVSGAPHLSPLAFFYACAMIFMGFLAIIGLHAVKKEGLDAGLHSILFWASSILGLEGYAVFGADPSLSLTLTYRLFNFLIPALSTLAGVSALNAILNGPRLRRAAFIACILFLATTMASQSYSAVILQENYLGYQWLYLPQDFQQALWIKRYGDGQVVYGDLKVKYLAEDYFGLKVDSAGGYAFLMNGGARSSGQLFAVYDPMEENGYLLGPYGIEIPRNRLEKLSENDRVFSNVNNVVYLV